VKYPRESYIGCLSTQVDKDRQLVSDGIPPVDPTLRVQTEKNTVKQEEDPKSGIQMWKKKGREGYPSAFSAEQHGLNKNSLIC
jgi:hypothetical protein